MLGEEWGGWLFYLNSTAENLEGCENCTRRMKSAKMIEREDKKTMMEEAKKELDKTNEQTIERIKKSINEWVDE